MCQEELDAQGFQGVTDIAPAPMPHRELLPRLLPARGNCDLPDGLGGGCHAPEAKNSPLLVHAGVDVRQLVDIQAIIPQDCASPLYSESPQP